MDVLADDQFDKINKILSFGVQHLLVYSLKPAGLDIGQFRLVDLTSLGQVVWSRDDLWLLLCIQINPPIHVLLLPHTSTTI